MKENQSGSGPPTAECRNGCNPLRNHLAEKPHCETTLPSTWGRVLSWQTELPTEHRSSEEHRALSCACIFNTVVVLRPAETWGWHTRSQCTLLSFHGCTTVLIPIASSIQVFSPPQLRQRCHTTTCLPRKPPCGDKCSVAGPKEKVNTPSARNW